MERNICNWILLIWPDSSESFQITPMGKKMENHLNLHQGQELQSDETRTLRQLFCYYVVFSVTRLLR